MVTKIYLPELEYDEWLRCEADAWDFECHRVFGKARRFLTFLQERSK